MFYPMFGAFTVNIQRSVILQLIVNVLCRLLVNLVKLLLQTDCQVVQAIIRAAILVGTICLPFFVLYQVFCGAYE